MVVSEKVSDGLPHRVFGLRKDNMFPRYAPFWFTLTGEAAVPVEVQSVTRTRPPRFHLSLGG